MSIESCRRLLKAENWSGSAPLQVFQMEEDAKIGPLYTAWSRLCPHAEAVMKARGQVQDTNEC